MTSPNLDLFRDIIAADEIENQILLFLQTWMQAYQNEVCRQRGIDPAGLPTIKSWGVLQDFYHEPQDQVPGVAVINAGTQSVAKTGAGWWRATFLVGLAVIVSARDRDSSNRVSKLYAAALRAAMLQKRAGGNMISDVSWTGESYDDIDIGRKAMLSSATGTFLVVADGLVKQSGAGPLAPITTEPDDLPVVAEQPGRIQMVGKE